MKIVPDPREAIRRIDRLDAPAVTADNSAERGWYPRDRGPHRGDR